MNRVHQEVLLQLEGLNFLPGQLTHIRRMSWELNRLLRNRADVCNESKVGLGRDAAACWAHEMVFGRVRGEEVLRLLALAGGLFSVGDKLDVADVWR